MKPAHRLVSFAPALRSLAAALALTAAAAAGTSVPPPPLHGYLCDESNAVLFDSYGNWNGEYDGNLFLAPGGAFDYPNNYRITFVPDSTVTLHDGNILAKRPASSFSAWFKYSDDGDERQSILYSERDGCGFNIFWVGVERRPGFPNGVSFGVFAGPSSPCGTGAWQLLTHPVVPSDGLWHHVVAVMGPAFGMRLYFDGALVGMMPGAVPYSGPGESASTIGHGHTPTTDTYWAGWVDDVALFGDALGGPHVTWLATHSLKDLPPATYPTFCLGDGSGAACPCGNESPSTQAAGCKNSFGSGGELRAYGTARLSHDTLSLSGTQLTLSWGLYIQGEAQDSGGAGTTLYDGIRCVGAPIIRLGMKLASGGYSYYPEPGDVPISVKGLVPAPGTTRHYQLMYRDTASFCTADLVNFTNGVSVTWGP